MKKRIEVEMYRPPKPPVGRLLRDEVPATSGPVVISTARELQHRTSSEMDALEAYKASERAKVLARVRKHRAKKAGK